MTEIFHFRPLGQPQRSEVDTGMLITRFVDEIKLVIILSYFQIWFTSGRSGGGVCFESDLTGKRHFRPVGQSRRS